MTFHVAFDGLSSASSAKESSQGVGVLLSDYAPPSVPSPQP